ncbi:MAG: TetR family transcriptional regulator [Natronospirillum sp.]|uniref:TetR/AcrR family transcriptional regulator n=1 Tax=Natronospirillum sp. TaxID=2812955 RepID=UPI0025D590B3|nr:TetR/AcrR family transcriptional regulator [Natronospirillum sp.]MCH8552388.1 TetR family transcriptional regulator [Natronospirillum sp.]
MMPSLKQMPSSDLTDTASRILDAAEHLFAEHGFTETSLRSITTRAGVNLAAVNYHFGSKEALVQAVFERFLTPFCRRLDRELDEAMARGDGQSPPLHDLFGLLARTMLAGVEDSTNDSKLSIFMRLLGLAYTQSQGHLRRFLRDHYDSTYRRFVLLVHQTTPHVSPNELFWRIHFAVGSAVFTMGSVETLRAIARNDTHQDNTLEDILHKLVPFVANALNDDRDH